MANRFSADDGAGTGRGGSPFDDIHSDSPLNARGGAGAETTGVESSQLSGNVHSSRGFRRALKSTQGRSNRLSGQLPSKKGFSGPGFRKPSMFAQGGARHGMHIGSGAPFTGSATSEAGGADTP
jgi:hypothetical protein